MKKAVSTLEYLTIEEYLKSIDDHTVLSKPRAEKAYRAETGKKPKYHKGKHGPTHDYWTCGNCGTILTHSVCENYCHNCGYKQLWDSPRCLTH